MASLFRLATQDVDLVKELKELMCRIPWEEVNVTKDDSVSYWFKLPGPGGISEEVTPQKQYTPEDVDMDENGQQDMDVDVPLHANKDENMGVNEPVRGSLVRWKPVDCPLPENEPPVADDMQQDNGSRVFLAPWKPVDDPHPANESPIANDMQQDNRSVAIQGPIRGGLYGVMRRPRQPVEEEDREDLPPAGSDDEEDEDDEAPVRKSTAVREEEMNEEDSDDVPPPTHSRVRRMQETPVSAELKKSLRKWHTPPQTQLPSPKKRKRVRASHHLTPGSSSELPIDVDNLFVSIMVPPSYFLPLTLSPGRAGDHPRLQGNTRCEIFIFFCLKC